MNEIVPVTTLHEPSLADAIAMIEQDPDLASSKRTHWLCSMRRIAESIGRPLELLPARMTALRHPVSRLNAARLGMSPKTLANHKANLKAALNHLAGQDAVASRGAPLSPPWSNLLEGVTDPWARKRIIPLFRYVRREVSSLMRSTMAFSRRSLRTASRQPSSTCQPGAGARSPVSGMPAPIPCPASPGTA